MLNSILYYLCKNPLELPAFILSILSLILIYRRYKVFLPSIFREQYSEGAEKHDYIKLVPAYDNQSLEIIGRPKISKIKLLLFSKKLLPEIDIIRKRDKETRQIIKNIHYIHLINLSEKLDKGKYIIKIKINRPPYKLKYKFKIPLS